ncbi:ABC transporter permease [Pontibacillus halophilus JSM 076056 = DSM 19796]|uniref:ABC transporter permease n=1 Tax=Pontibacillus halophilus JSM 076056 = DSM 19796 TaxID=1385510 RepID=A0A0A5GH64_9BACI|nr:ABC transporter permease subunit [Pontibacillus halophilus]KGX90538.1 ABC transporter permease [Pontibacillus halophilus JSM 076056 = DSM 19796]
MKRNKWVFFILTFTFSIFPVLFLLVKSVTENFQLSDGTKLRFTLDGWGVLLSENQLAEATWTSIGIGFVVVLLNLWVGITGGRVLAFESFRGKSAVETAILFPLIIPVLAITLGIHLVFIRIGLADTWYGVVLIHLVPTIPYTIRIMRNSYVTIGHDMLEQAKTLGGSGLARFISIEVPLLKPAIRSAVFLIFVISLSQYVVTTIIGGGNVVTLALVYFPFLQSANSAIIAAFSIWFAVIPLLFYLVFELLLTLLPYQKRWRTHE